ncbi:MAG: hypothetical protein DMG05_25015 [Acidobacteria bacterium]|nr:MAG: hypothetical protein DMG05_25015 [Acidobacteriota bacterium]
MTFIFSSFKKVNRVYVETDLGMYSPTLDAATDLHRGRQGGCPLGLVGGGVVKTKGEGRAGEREKTKDFIVFLSR